MACFTKAERRDALDTLRQYVKPGDTVMTILRHVSRSGMMRVIDPLIMSSSGPHTYTPIYLRGLMQAAGLGSTHRRHDGLRVDGCGMDMGFHLVYTLGRVLWPEGYKCSGNGCGSNDHSNPPYPKRDGRSKHSDGGYALDQRWL